MATHPTPDTQVLPGRPFPLVFERDGNLMVRADLPGLRKEDVRILVTDDALVLEGERRREVEEERGGLYRAERERLGPLAQALEEIRLPLPKERERGRRIEIKGGSEKEGSVH